MRYRDVAAAKERRATARKELTANWMIAQVPGRKPRVPPRELARLRRRAKAGRSGAVAALAALEGCSVSGEFRRALEATIRASRMAKAKEIDASSSGREDGYDSAARERAALKHRWYGRRLRRYDREQNRPAMLSLARPPGQRRRALLRERARLFRAVARAKVEG